MKITIEGKEGNIKKLLKSNRLFLKRNGLAVSFDEEKEEVEEPLKAGELVELIGKCETLESLEAYKDYEQKTVIKAFEAKKKELEQ